MLLQSCAICIMFMILKTNYKTGDGLPKFAQIFWNLYMTQLNIFNTKTINRNHEIFLKNINKTW